MRRSLVLLALFGGSGCDDEADVYSPDVSTLDLQVSVYAKDEGQGASVEVDVQSPLGALRFSGGDVLRLSLGGAPLTLRDGADDYGDPIYLADAPSLSDDLVMDLERPADRSIQGFVIPVPPQIGLVPEPVAGKGPLVFTWSGAPGAAHRLTLRVEGACFQPIVRDLPNDVGSYAIVNAELLPAASAAPCPISVTLTRSEITQGKLMPEAPLYQFYTDVTVAQSALVDWTP